MKNWQPNQLSVIIDGKITGYNRIIGDLQQFIRSLPPDRRNQLAALGLAEDTIAQVNPDQLTILETTIDEVSGLASPKPPGEGGPPPANIPPDLKALVAEFDKAHQTAISAQAQRQGWSPKKFGWN